jgi:hypothetical protein
MEAILKFNLPEETDEFNSALNGWRWKIVVAEFDAYLRTQLKYKSDNYSDSELELIENLRETLHQTIEESGVSLM